VSQPLKEKDLSKEETDPDPGKDECHPYPYFASNGHFAFGIQKIPQSDTDENNGDGDENDA
jgi:hypothetical protein